MCDKREVCDTRDVGRKRALKGGSPVQGKVGGDEWLFEVIESGGGAVVGSSSEGR